MSYGGLGAIMPQHMGGSPTVADPAIVAGVNPTAAGLVQESMAKTSQQQNMQDMLKMLAASQVGNLASGAVGAAFGGGQGGAAAGQAMNPLMMLIMQQLMQGQQGRSAGANIGPQRPR